jgi:hypothetical protein
MQRRSPGRVRSGDGHGWWPRYAMVPLLTLLVVLGVAAATEAAADHSTAVRTMAATAYPQYCGTFQSRLGGTSQMTFYAYIRQGSPTCPETLRVLKTWADCTGNCHTQQFGQWSCFDDNGQSVQAGWVQHCSRPDGALVSDRFKALGSCSGGSSKCDEPLNLLAPPKVGGSFNVARVRGAVLVRLPGLARFVSIEQARHVPNGSVVDTRRGKVSLVSASDARGSVQSALFHGGLFRLRQRRAAHPLTELHLTGPIGPCPSGHRAGVARGRPHRHLWGNGHGSYGTFGRDSSATVGGTWWLTEDRCDGTLTVVRRGVVKVRDFHRHRTVTVTAGHSYLARHR